MGMRQHQYQETQTEQILDRIQLFATQHSSNVLS